METHTVLDIYSCNPYTGHPDMLPEVYVKAYQNIAESKAWQDKFKQ